MLNFMKKPAPKILIVLISSLLLNSGCSFIQPENTDDSHSNSRQSTEKPQTKPDDSNVSDAISKPDDITVLVNKDYKLPDQYVPSDLVYPDVPFIFDEKIDKRKMRNEPAEALKKMFDGALLDNIHLAGVSGYRSEATQKMLFDNYVNKDGLEEADKYSARPGHSEHQTGLSIDVSGITGEFAVEDGFANTAEAKWLEEHAHEYGFIIRFPKGKENITGYKYEPWHIRYVGINLATEMKQKGITLEEYYDETLPVNK